MLVVFMLALALLLLAVFIPKKNGYEYNAMDKIGVVTNIVLIFVYAVLSLMGVFTIFFADAPWDGYSALKKKLLEAIIFMGVSMPIWSIASLFTSVLTRRMGKSKFGFIIQFLPLLVFAAMLVLIFVSEKV